MHIKKSINKLITMGVALPVIAALTIGAPGFFIAQTLVAHADSIGPTTFEPGQSFVLGSINGQNGWGGDGTPVNPTYDQGVVTTTVSGFGTQSLRISDAVTSGAFGDWIFAAPLTNAAGEPSSTADTFSVGTLQPHFETQFDFASTQETVQPGLHVSVSPDRGDGSRMSYLRLEDATSGIAVFFDDVQGTSNPASFVETQVATGLSRTVKHTAKLVMDFASGPSNDVAQVYIDGVLVHTGTSWENYYRFDSEAVTEQSSRVIKTIIMQARGTATPANLGKGFLFDNVSLVSSTPTPPPATTTVTIAKYLDGSLATVSSTGGATFPLTATWNATNIGAGSGNFSLGPVGFNNPTPYEATTADMTAGASYSIVENLPTICDANTPYRLAGYTTGASLAAAASSTPTTTSPSFTNLAQNQFVIVWNNTCVITPPTSTLKVHVVKYLNGAKATASSSNSYLFPMSATWTTANLNGGATSSGSYLLGNNFGGASDTYGADTAAMQSPANYATNEITNDLDNTSNVLPIEASCVAGKYRLDSYQTSPISFADALTQATSTNSPAFLGLTADAYVIVNNITCPTTGSLIVEKDAIGGNGTFTFTGSNGLGTFSITTVSGTGSQTFNNLAPGTYAITETGIPSGWTQSAGNATSVVVTAGGVDTLVITNTMNARLGAIRGTKYIDRDGDGSLKDGDHHRLAGVTIYLDTNNNGVLNPGEPSMVTNKFGEYRFLNLPAGTYYVREVGQPGWKQTYPSSGSYTIALAAGKVSRNNNFGNFKFGTISGMKFNDLNSNGHKSGNEPGLAGWTIKLTKLNSSFATTTVTDANGNYSFANLAAGKYQVREVQQTGWHQTTGNPSNITVISGTNSKNDNFGNHFGPDPRNQGWGWWWNGRWFNGNNFGFGGGNNH